jgi:ferritin-like metal-binding protein YciE
LRFSIALTFQSSSGLGEEKKTDEPLTKLAQSEVNQHTQAA